MKLAYDPSAVQALRGALQALDESLSDHPDPLIGDLLAEVSYHYDDLAAKLQVVAQNFTEYTRLSSELVASLMRERDRAFEELAQMEAFQEEEIERAEQRILEEQIVNLTDALIDVDVEATRAHDLAYKITNAQDIIDNPQDNLDAVIEFANLVVYLAENKK